MPMGPLQAADGDLAGEHALEDLDDEHGVLLVELPGGDHGFAEGKALDLDRRRDGAEAEAVVLGAVADVGELRGDLDGNRLCRRAER